MKDYSNKTDIPASANYPDDSFVSDDEIEDLTKLDYDRSVIMNMAGPLNAKKAIGMVHRIMGDKEKKHPLKPKYIRQDILDKIKELEEEFEKEKLENSEGTNNSEDLSLSKEISPDSSDNKSDTVDSQEPKARFYAKAMQDVNRINGERAVILGKIARNFKLFIVVAALFAGYFVYTVYTRNDDALAVRGIKNKLPMKIDDHLILNDIALSQKTFFLDIIMSKTDFFDAENKDIALDLYIKKTSDNFCNIQIFSDMIKSGKKISVVLNAEDGSFSKSFTVEHCEK
ncbi:MAG: hypothetical protein SPK70_06585 [Succinivibrio dextrinosolvens]|uniref:Uncharacterized protein n=1 Tax=Succinivibrio dextrinosolvens TaxID=83771 RepID=A0A662ZC22_9GAMM|nr:hypothetical protein [Succinivibrio dextrinosolvens]MDY6419056.1 hypothetical protein [Succinivibrio dextrinosolvens]MDY6470715.1 hypothetical protein [Succinivibrio dextrinosolvens]SFK00356.1 hypothetical protein SAMN04487865_101340 [Succinivibrio dextrinosolvens]